MGPGGFPAWRGERGPRGAGHSWAGELGELGEPLCTGLGLLRPLEVLKARRDVHGLVGENSERRVRIVKGLKRRKEKSTEENKIEPSNMKIL